ncbi:MAG: hypothetical protein FWF90_16040 [Promicromonosporaceae bacterium]|nr:hypothetical protein [Promicromonosporaceae bacterium]
MIVERAPGKLFVAGEFAVVEPGQPAVLMAVDRHLTVSLTEADGAGTVRSPRFLRGEARLVLAWVGEGPARAVGGAGQPVELPQPDMRRDGSGTPLPAPITSIG